MIFNPGALSKLSWILPKLAFYEGILFEEVVESGDKKVIVCCRYIFKRLKFLGNKDISQATTLFFLAIWHGLFSGYFMNFFLEFPIIKFEREVRIRHFKSHFKFLLKVGINVKWRKNCEYKLYVLASDQSHRVALSHQNLTSLVTKQ